MLFRICNPKGYIIRIYNLIFDACIFDRGEHRPGVLFRIINPDIRAFGIANPKQQTDISLTAGFISLAAGCPSIS